LLLFNATLVILVDTGVSANLCNAASTRRARQERFVSEMQEVVPENFDLVIIGSGAGAKLAAWEFAGSGQRVAVIERKYIGGSCPNIACLPSKNVIHSAEIVHRARQAAEFGANGNTAVDMSAVRARKRRMVDGLVSVHLDIFRSTGTELILGQARFIGPKIVEVTEPNGDKRIVQGTNILIGTGTHATLGGVSGLAEAKPLTHIEALELDTVPEHLIILGAGYVGLEFAQAMRRFGSQVTIVDHNSHVLHREDTDVRDAIHELLRSEGIEVVLGAKVLGVEGESSKEVTVTVEQHGRRSLIVASHLLVAAGRTPNTDGLGLEAAGVELTAKGYIKVDERLQTSSPGVWAVGEIAGSPQFTHVSEDDFRVFRSSITGGSYVTTNRLIPYCLFLDPELGRVGLSETEAKAKGIQYRLFKAPIRNVLRAQALMEDRGFMKALVAVDSDEILGFTSFGVNAGEVMSTVQLAMIGKLSYTVLRDALFAHPTMVEGLHALFGPGPVQQAEASV
jgi:pyruvate/2-oxoglutarate dehydrogenase complex dihydrolipoamide dehydrogenase (E3) component